MKNFLNVADEAISTFITQEKYESSLVMHILFQEEILIEEGYLGDSSKTFNHITNARDKGENSLFLEGIRQGVILPVLREVGNQPVESLFQRYEATYHGNFPILKPDHYEIKIYLTEALKESFDIGSKIYNWPDDKNKSREIIFQNYLKNNLQRQIDLHNLNTACQELWKKTEIYRIDVLEEASKRTQKQGKQGIRRTEIVNVVGEKFGVSPTDDGSQIPAILEASKNDEVVMAFFRWVNQCLHYAQADFFETAIHFPVYDLSGDFIASTPRDNSDNKEDVQLERASFKYEVNLPPPDKLAKVDPIQLLKIRKDLGKPYFSALNEWSYSPNQKTLQQVEHTLKKYSERLCRNFSPETLYQIELMNEKPKIISDLLKEQSLKLLPELTGVPLGITAQQIGKLWMRSQHLGLEFKHKVEPIEVTAPLLSM